MRMYCLIAAAAIAGAGAVASADVTLGFPSTTSISGGPTGSGPLGPGGGGAHFITGDDLSQTFLGTGLGSTNKSRWVFKMSDFTASGVHNTFDILINGTKVGDFFFDGNGSSQTHSFDVTFNHTTIAGPDYTLRMVATSTVPP